jgi:hypothetical protein
VFDDSGGPSTTEYARHFRPWNWTLVPSSRRAPNITAARTEFVYSKGEVIDQRERFLVAPVGFAGLPRPS